MGQKNRMLKPIIPSFQYSNFPMVFRFQHSNLFALRSRLPPQPSFFSPVPLDNFPLNGNNLTKMDIPLLISFPDVLPTRCNRLRLDENASNFPIGTFFGYAKNRKLPMALIAGEGGRPRETVSTLLLTGGKSLSICRRCPIGPGFAEFGIRRRSLAPGTWSSRSGRRSRPLAQEEGSLVPPRGSQIVKGHAPFHHR